MWEFVAGSDCAQEYRLDCMVGIWVCMHGSLDDTAFLVLAYIAEKWNAKTAKVPWALDKLSWV
jgi:hypothetical protein